MIKHVNMEEYGHLFERYSIDFEDDSVENIRSSRYNDGGKVIKRRNITKASKYTEKIFEKTIIDFQSKNIYGDLYRFGDGDEEPDVITVIKGSTKYDFKNIYRSEIYYKRIKGIVNIPRSSFSAIYPVRITEEYKNLGFNFGDLWSTCYIDYKVNNDKHTLDIARINIYIYTVTDKDKRDRLTEDIDNRKDFSI